MAGTKSNTKTDTRTASQVSSDPTKTPSAAVVGTTGDPEMNKPADIAPATEFSPSGAPRQTPGIDPDHPAIDNNPRANTTVGQNKIDMNDPTLEGHEAVVKNLNAQGVPTKGREEAEDETGK